MTTPFDPANWSDDDFEVISESDVESVRRGRRPNDAAVDLAMRLANLKVGQIIRIAVLTANTPAEKQANGYLIRSAAKLANIKVGIRWAPNGTPQVTIKKG